VSKSIISYIETEQWSKLPARTYARGYFANYVRYVGLPYEEMMAQFDLTYSVATRPPQLSAVGAISEQKSFPWLTTLAVIGITVTLWFAYAEWQQSQQAIIEVEPAELSTAPELDGEASINANAGIEP
jgi:cytoskeleton protein RodZ